MRAGWLMAFGLGLAACATQPATPLPDPSRIAAHEWDHGPPWGPEEIPWAAPPALAFAPGYAAPWYGSPWYGPGYWGPSFGVGIGIGRGHWWRGHPGWRGGGPNGGWRGGGGWHGGGGHFRGGGRGRR